MSLDFTNFGNNLSNLDLDQIFDTAGAAVETGRAVYNVVNDGINGMYGASRRNAGGFTNNQQPMNYQPMTYGYGYEERGYNYNFGNNSSYNRQNQNTGYYGFTNAMYGKSGY